MADQGDNMAVCLQVKVRGRGLSLRPIGCTPALSVTKVLVVPYKCYVPLPYCAT